MNIILFGPPGVGKSTLIGHLKTLGERAIDLEDVYPSRVRFSLPNQLKDVIIGGADLDPIRRYPNAIKVFVLTDTDEVYQKRRKARDAEQPGKANQTKHTMGQWVRLYMRSKGETHLILNDGSISSGAEEILQIKELCCGGHDNGQPNV